NCDFSYGLEEAVIEAEQVRIFCCHGHKYGVKSGLGRLAARAKELDCSVALYGHTHRADISEVGGVLCVNPGAAGDYTSPSYCYLVVHGAKVTPTVVPIL
ncbi:MAG TPA: YfcE family phosphodiesterase, partial [Firmicutes bacterium]|nr:YfcE family phosphodiesterase [Bacillota bacterium]